MWVGEVINELIVYFTTININQLGYLIHFTSGCAACVGKLNI